MSSLTEDEKRDMETEKQSHLTPARRSDESEQRNADSVTVRDTQEEKGDANGEKADESSGVNDDDYEIEYPTGLKLALLSLGLCLVIFVVCLSNTYHFFTIVQESPFCRSPLTIRLSVRNAIPRIARIVLTDIAFSNGHPHDHNSL